MLNSKINIKNKKASFNFEFLEKYLAGIKLSGTEIKSLRAGKANLTDAFCFFHDHELYVKGLHIAEYTYGTYNNHDPGQDRKLLLNRKELDKLEQKINQKGLSVVATRVFINDRGLAKLEIALAKGKKEYDKREDLKARDAKKEMERARKF